MVPESGERKRNLTTLVLVKNAAVKRSRSRQKVSESSQNPLKWSCTAQSFGNVMPDVFESIISSQTSCAPGHLKTVMSLSPLSRWSWSATMITTWTGTLAGMAILIAIGSGWILHQECTNYGHSAETSLLLDILWHVMRPHFVSSLGCPSG